MFENVDGGRTTGARVIGILIAHLGAFSSGEVIINCPLVNHFFYLNLF